MSRTITISNRIRYNGVENTSLDYWYGPYNSISECLIATQNQESPTGDIIKYRYNGMTVGIKEEIKDGNGQPTGKYKVVDYVFLGGIEDTDLIAKGTIYENDFISKAKSQTLSEVDKYIPKYDNGTITWPNMDKVSIVTQENFTNITNKFNTDISSIQGNLIAVRGDLDTNVQTISGKINKFNTDISTIQGNLVAVRGDLDTNVQSITGKINKFNNDITSIQGNLVAVQGNLNTSVNDITNRINKEINTIQGHFTAVQGNINASAQELSDKLAKEIRTVQGSIDSTFVAVQGTVNQNRRLIEETRISVEETNTTAAITGLNMNNTLNLEQKDIQYLVNKVASMDAIPEASVISSIRNTDTYRFVRIISYKNKNLYDLTEYEKHGIIQAINNVLINDNNKTLDKYVYLFADNNTTLQNGAGEYTCYYVNNLDQIKLLQIKHTFTVAEFNSYKQSESNIIQQTINDSGTDYTCEYKINNNYDTGLTEALLKIYSITYGWKLITNFYNENGTPTSIFTNDSTGDGVADFDERLCKEPKLITNNGPKYFEYELKDEYMAEGEGTIIWETIKYLTNNGTKNTKYVYLVCYKDSKLPNTTNEFGFYFRPYVWYNNGVYRLNCEINMGYTMDGQNWNYLTPIELPYTVNGISYNTIDDLLYQTETQTTVKIIRPYQPEQPEVNQIKFKNSAVISDSILNTIINETYDCLTNNITIQNSRYNLDSELYQLSNYFTYSSTYNTLTSEQQNYIDYLDSLLIGLRKYIITTNNSNFIKIISYALASIMCKYNLIDENDLIKVDKNKNIDYFNEDDDIEYLIKVLNIDNIIFHQLIYDIADLLINFSQYDSSVTIYNVFHSMFKLNHNIGSINYIEMICKLINDIEILENNLKNVNKISDNILKCVTSKYVGNDVKRVEYKALAKLKLVKYNNPEILKDDINKFNLTDNYQNITEQSYLDFWHTEDTKYISQILDIYNHNDIALDFNFSGQSEVKLPILSIENSYLQYSVYHKDMVPAIPEISESVVNTFINPKTKTDFSNNEAAWFDVNSVLTFIMDKQQNTDSITYTFEYRKWNKSIRDWVDYGMEIVNVDVTENNNWQLYKPTPSLTATATANRINQRTINKTNQNNTSVRLDIANIAQDFNTTNTAQAEINEVLVNEINKLVGIINKMNIDNNPNNAMLLKGLCVNEGKLVPDTELKKLDVTTGSLVAVTSTNTIPVTPNTVKIDSVVNINTNTLQTSTLPKETSNIVTKVNITK